ncbi:MAG: PAS domain S-box protein [Balneolaceae bacterium]|nr:PAS domain S-box protein [Balneolaceae bacterium]MCH8549752.1 PAS domain S-box protein [Balneolaceae bacterium]
MNHYKTTFDNMPLPAIVLKPDSPNFTVVEINEALYTILKNPSREIAGKPFFSIFPGNPDNPDDEHAIAVNRSLHKLLETGKADQMGIIEVDEESTEGTPLTRYYDLTNIPLFDDRGRIENILHTVRDVTNEVQQEREIAKKEKRFRALVENGSDVLLILSTDGKPIYASPTIKNVLGYTPEEALNFEITNVCHPDDIETIASELEIAINNPGVPIKVTPARMRHKDGNWRWLEGTITNMLDDPAVGGIVDNFRDVTETIETRQKLERIYELAKIGTWELNIEEQSLHWSRFVRELHEVPSGYKPDLENAINFYKEGENRDKISQAVEKTIADGSPFDLELEIITFQGSHRWIRTTGQAEFTNNRCTRIYGSTQDISQRMEAREALVESLKEKETLLSEIHHRVKNNLAIVSSLMELQAMSTDDEKVSTHLLEGTLRIKSMAGIHEQLYQSSNFSRIKMADSLDSLIRNILNAFYTDFRVDFRYKTDDVELNLIQAVPCSLLVNEVVTNALKHAYKGVDTPKLEVELKELSDRVYLTIIDNGSGLPEDFNPESAGSMGMQLIRVLTEQLKGEFSYRSAEPGAIFELQFRKMPITGIDLSL